ncbi:MAG: sodium/solute symporter [Planctomycetales bacterium]|nr:sodium/solute symporter [Planctomycetales bacterium]
MTQLDWFVVACYSLGMLLVGIYFARRTKTANEYLLGGRAMRPWAVGLSLFATLLSTLSYLAWPGEMIKNGPMILIGYVSYPLVFLVVGWVLIPKIRALEVTSAYEILEQRLGLSVRLLGSTLFLSLRLLWMASIIFWTTRIVLLPVAGLHPRHTAACAIILGIITVVYTSLGGLRAVVYTDVVQTLILLSGVLVSLGLITSELGGFGGWIPTEWADHWTPPRLWFDFAPEARSTLANAMLGTFSWSVCTAGADQMAIQRYSATPSIRAARRTLAISLATEVTVTFLLGCMGLALLAYFTARPEQLAEGQTVFDNADKLLPRFVVVGLPPGLSGLVIAGLLAAAMSSLSSGVNSSATVISEDFIRRFSVREQTEFSRLRQVRVVSAVVGLSVVVLSSLIGMVQGNMLEVVYRVVNLFTAPLFYLFFMAIFVPWANTTGTWIGSIAGIATAVLIAFWKVLFGVQGISFLWILPGSFAVSVTVGSVASIATRRFAVAHSSNLDNANTR